MRKIAFIVLTLLLITANCFAQIITRPNNMNSSVYFGRKVQDNDFSFGARYTIHIWKNVQEDNSSAYYVQVNPSSENDFFASTAMLTAAGQSFTLEQMILPAYRGYKQEARTAAYYSISQEAFVALAQEPNNATLVLNVLNKKKQQTVNLKDKALQELKVIATLNYADYFDKKKLDF